MPATEKQLEANRRNALLSTGPRTETGKAASSLNAFRHGLTGTVTIMTPEDRLAHDLFVTDYVAALKPEGPIERELAESIAQNFWRLKRARSLDQNIYSLAHPALNAAADVAHESPEVVTAASEAKAFLAEAKQLQLLTLYEQRIQRALEKNVERLEALQAQRRAEHAAAFEEAQRLARLSYVQRKPYDPAADFPPENGFVFSTTEINRAILREDRHRHIRVLEEQNWVEKSWRRPRTHPIIEEARRAGGSRRQS